MSHWKTLVVSAGSATRLASLVPYRVGHIVPADGAPVGDTGFAISTAALDEGELSFEAGQVGVDQGMAVHPARSGWSSGDPTPSRGRDRSEGWYEVLDAAIKNVLGSSRSAAGRRPGAAERHGRPAARSSAARHPSRHRKDRSPSPSRS